MGSGLSQFSQSKWPRIILAGPWTLLASFIVMASMATWIPAGEAKVDNIMIPMVLFPFIWALMFFHAALSTNLKQATIVNLAVTFTCITLLVVHFQ